MSDAPQNGGMPAPHFLQRLVDGAFDLVRSLEPRRPSLFERPSFDVADTVEHALNSIVDEGAIRRSAPAGDGTDWTPPRGRASTANAELISDRWRADDDRSIEAAQGAMPDRARETVDRARQPAEPTPQWRSERSQGVRDARPVPALLVANVDLDVQRDLSAHTADAPAHDTRDVSIVPTPELGTLVGPHVDVGGLHADPPTPLPDRRHRLHVDLPGAVDRTARDSLQAGAVAAAVPEPVVNVTIGRIEVRVAPVQPSPRRQRVEPPKPMSLDQYLQRRGGQR
jgi:hypothetical protein